MIYLVIIVLLAAAGIATIWLQQRREQAHLETVEGFRSSLETLSMQAEEALIEPTTPRAVRAAERPARGAPRGAPHLRRQPPPLDPARRAAAKKRLEARRRAMAEADR